MKDWDFRIGRIWGCLTARPETNCFGFFVDRRGWCFSINIGLVLFSVLICVDFESPLRGHLRRTQKASE